MSLDDGFADGHSACFVTDPVEHMHGDVCVFFGNHCLCSLLSCSPQSTRLAGRGSVIFTDKKPRLEMLVQVPRQPQGQSERVILLT